MTQQTFCSPNSMIERVGLSKRAQPRTAQGKRLSAHGFQTWLGHWQNLRADGWDVTVLLAADETHAVALAWKEPL